MAAAYAVVSPRLNRLAVRVRGGSDLRPGSVAVGPVMPLPARGTAPEEMGSSVPGGSQNSPKAFTAGHANHLVSPGPLPGKCAQQLTATGFSPPAAGIRDPVSAVPPQMPPVNACVIGAVSTRGRATPARPAARPRGETGSHPRAGGVKRKIDIVGN